MTVETTEMKRRRRTGTVRRIGLLALILGLVVGMAACDAGVVDVTGVDAGTEGGRDKVKGEGGVQDTNALNIDAQDATNEPGQTPRPEQTTSPEPESTADPERSQEQEPDPVEGMPSNSGGTEIEFKGTVNAIDGNTVTVNGQTLTIPVGYPLPANLTEGAFVEVEARLDASGNLVLLEIEVEDSVGAPAGDDSGHGDEDDSVDDSHQSDSSGDDSPDDQSGDDSSDDQSGDDSSDDGSDDSSDDGGSQSDDSSDDSSDDGGGDDHSDDDSSDDDHRGDDGGGSDDGGGGDDHGGDDD